MFGVCSFSAKTVELKMHTDLRSFCQSFQSFLNCSIVFLIVPEFFQLFHSFLNCFMDFSIFPWFAQLFHSFLNCSIVFSIAP